MIRQGSVSSTSTSSGSLGSSGFVSPGARPQSNRRPPAHTAASPPRQLGVRTSGDPASSLHIVKLPSSFNTSSSSSSFNTTSSPSSHSRSLGDRTRSPASHPQHAVQLPSTHSAFRRPRPVQDKRQELEVYASQWQTHRGNRR